MTSWRGYYQAVSLCRPCDLFCLMSLSLFLTPRRKLENQTERGQLNRMTAAAYQGPAIFPALAEPCKNILSGHSLSPERQPSAPERRGHVLPVPAVVGEIESSHRQLLTSLSSFICSASRPLEIPGSSNP